jgi:isoquinoline 1-oxidoreductase subunit beta
MAVAGSADNGYSLPSTRVEAAVKNTHMPVWFWRAPGAGQHAFAIESFLDEIASAGGLDPPRLKSSRGAG